MQDIVETLLFFVPIATSPEFWPIAALSFIMRPSLSTRNWSFGETLASVSLVPKMLACAYWRELAVVPLVLSNVESINFQVPLLLLTKLPSLSLLAGFYVSMFEAWTWNFLVRKPAISTYLERSSITQLISFFARHLISRFGVGQLSEEIRLNLSVVLFVFFVLRIWKCKSLYIRFLWLFAFVGFLVYSIPSRLYWLSSFEEAAPLFSYWLSLLVGGIPLILSASKYLKVVIARKLFHILILMILLPPLLFYGFQIYPLVSCGSFVALGVFFMLEEIRRSKGSGFVEKITCAFADNKGEEFVFSHMALLVGCVLPLWLSRVSENDNLLFSGIITVGVGDAFAAILGVSLPKVQRMPGSSRSLEGLIAFICSTAICSYLLSLSRESAVYPPIVALLLTGLVETYTKSMDNLILPIYFMAVVNGLDRL